MKVICLFLFLTVSTAYSQELSINPYTGVAPSYLIADIDKLTFGNDSLFVHLNNGSIYSWYLLDLQTMEYDLVVELIEESIQLIDARIYPNPAHEWLEIILALPSAQSVEVVFYDAMGKEINRFAKRELDEGTHVLKWDFHSKSTVNSGYVTCVIYSDNQTITKSIVIN